MCLGEDIGFVDPVVPVSNEFFWKSSHSQGDSSEALKLRIEILFVSTLVTPVFNIFNMWVHGTENECQNRHIPTST